MTKHPNEGGSYIRQPDGSLKRAVEPEPTPEAEQPTGQGESAQPPKSKLKSKPNA